MQVVEPRLLITGSHAWQRQLIALAENTQQSIVLDMRNVEKIDTACLQVLTAFVLQARASAVAITWHAPSDHFLAAVHSLNLNAIFGIKP